MSDLGEGISAFNHDRCLPPVCLDLGNGDFCLLMVYQKHSMQSVGILGDGWCWWRWCGLNDLGGVSLLPIWTSL